MGKRQRKLFVSCAALAVALFALGTGEATATAPFDCRNIAPFCHPTCECDISSRTESCESCGSQEEVWCENEN